MELTQPKFSTVGRGAGRGLPRNSKGLAEGEEETAKRFKALERTREAGTAQDYGSVAPGLVLGAKKHDKR